jgi:hypothetical protein
VHARHVRIHGNKYSGFRERKARARTREGDSEGRSQRGSTEGKNQKKKPEIIFQISTSTSNLEAELRLATTSLTLRAPILGSILGIAVVRKVIGVPHWRNNSDLQKKKIDKVDWGVVQKTKKKLESMQ